MSGRHRPGSGAPAAPARSSRDGPSLDSLPDTVLLEIIKLVSIPDRYEHVACVNRRFRRLCLGPELLRTLALSLSGEFVEDRVHALLRLFTTHGAHVRQLSLWVHPAGDEDEGGGQRGLELAALVASCLAVLGAGGCALEQLHLGGDTPLATTAWAESLTALRVLRLGSRRQELRLHSGLRRLGRLQSALFRGGPLHLPRPGSLPPSLTELELAGAEEDELGLHFEHLSRLQRLALSDAGFDPEAMDELAALPQLTWLHLSYCPLPACLPAMRRLHTLGLLHTASDEEDLDGLLRGATQLRRLAVGVDGLSAVPCGVRALRRLERLYFYSSRWPDQPYVPPGPWLAGLRWLGLLWEGGLLAAADGVLAQAVQLQYLSLLDPPFEFDEDGVPVPGWQRFWRWARRHPALRCLGFDFDAARTDGLPMGVVDALLDLKAARPELQVRRTQRQGRRPFFAELLHDEAIPSGAG